MLRFKFDDLSTKNLCRMNQINIIRVLTSGALSCLCDLLGVGVGVGLGNPRQQKEDPRHIVALMTL
jgi:hypothetical protein